MKANYKLAEFPSYDLGSACEMAEKWKQYYEARGYKNVLFSIQETNLQYRFRIEIWGYYDEEEDKNV